MIFEAIGRFIVALSNLNEEAVTFVIALVLFVLVIIGSS